MVILSFTIQSLVAFKVVNDDDPDTFDKGNALNGKHLTIALSEVKI